MDCSVYVSGGGKLRHLSFRGGIILGEASIGGCGAVCARGGTVFAAGDTEGVIYRLDDRLLPCGVYGGGPGMSALRISEDGARLFVLLSDADSVLMLSGQDGAPMLLACVGANPRQMHLDGEANTLTVAGGRDGSASLLCAHTLKTLCTFREDGVCCDALYFGGRIYALLLAPSLDTSLVIWELNGSCRRFSFPGLPGSLLRVGKTLLVSAGQWLYVFEASGMRLRQKRYLGGSAGKMIFAGGEIMLLCPDEEALYRFTKGERRLLCAQARDASGE